MLTGLMISAFLLGLAGGLHCLAMCGGLCAAMGRPPENQSAGDLRAAWVLQLGRVMSYTAAGALAGGFVQTMAWASDQASLFKPAWVILHAGMLAWGLMLLILARQPLWAQTVTNPVLHRIAWVKQSSWRSLFLGTGWAMLPCGLLYSALLLAGLTGGYWQGAAVMLAFVLPTVVWLMGAQRLFAYLTLFRQPLAQQWTRRLAGLALVVGATWALWQHAVYGIRAIC